MIVMGLGKDVMKHSSFGHVHQMLFSNSRALVLFFIVLLNLTSFAYYQWES
jgi:hypothetical protein